MGVNYFARKSDAEQDAARLRKCDRVHVRIEDTGPNGSYARYKVIYGPVKRRTK